MTTLEALNAVADAIRAATADMLLEKAESMPGDPKVHLTVTPGYVAPRNADMSAYGGGYHAPCVIVGMDEGGGSDDGKEAGFTVMVTVGTYSPGTARTDGTTDLNNDGYIDLLLVIERIKGELLHKPVLPYTVIQPPVRWGMYQDQPYPYWYGWVSFDVKVAVLEALEAAPDDFLTMN